MNYRSETTSQPKNNNLDHMIDPNLERLIICFFFHTKMVTMVLQEILLVDITYH